MNNVDTTETYALVVGMGATGYSIAKYLHKRGVAFHVFDTRVSSMMTDQFRRAFPGSRLYFEAIDDEVLLGATEIYLSPGVPRDEACLKRAIAAGLNVVGDIELFLREVAKPVIGITGSNGKSTVTTLVGLAAKEAGIAVAVGGNIGIPALELLDVEADLYVLELSSFQLESVSHPQLKVACHLNISADHMDRYDTLDDYVAAKQRIFLGAQCAVFNIDDTLTRPALGAAQRSIGFGLQRSSAPLEEAVIYDQHSGDLHWGEEVLINKAHILIKGMHNVQNALALYAIAKAADIDLAACGRVLKSFAGLPHRCEFVAERGGVTYINDSKATNVGAAEAAILGLAGEFSGIVLIAGGEGKGADFSALGELIRRQVRVLILLGKDAQKIRGAVGDSVTAVIAPDMPSAVKRAIALALPGELVLLSPACASLDMFANFEERGHVFAQSVIEFLGDVAC